MGSRACLDDMNVETSETSLPVVLILECVNVSLNVQILTALPVLMPVMLVIIYS